MGVLHDADIVDERQEMIGAQARQVQLGDARRPAPWRERAGLRQHGSGCFSDGRPRERRADLPGFRACSRELLRVVEVAADRVGDGLGIAERHEEPGSRSEHVLRVPVGSRDDGAARGERERQRAGGDLLSARVRRQEDVGLREQVRDLVDGEEPIVEHDVCPEAELEGATLEHQPVSLAFATLDVGMSAAGDRVDELRIPLDHRR